MTKDELRSIGRDAAERIRRRTVHRFWLLYGFIRGLGGVAILLAAAAATAGVAIGMQLDLALIGLTTKEREILLDRGVLALVGVGALIAGNAAIEHRKARLVRLAEHERRQIEVIEEVALATIETARFMRGLSMTTHLKIRGPKPEHVELNAKSYEEHWTEAVETYGKLEATTLRLRLALGPAHPLLAQLERVRETIKNLVNLPDAAIGPTPDAPYKSKAGAAAAAFSMAAEHAHEVNQLVSSCSEELVRLRRHGIEMGTTQG